MLKSIFILLCVMSVHTICGLEVGNVQKVAADEPKLDDEPYGTAEAIKSTKEIAEGQRQKRFYDYSYVGYNTGSSAFSSIIPTFPDYASSDPYHSTNVPNVPEGQKRLNEIIRRLQHIADLTRVNFQPTSNRRPQIPFLIPFPTFSQGCTCPPTNENPATKPSVAPTKPPATYLPPATQAPGIATTNTPDFNTRVGEDAPTKTNVSDDDYDDGAREISFVPIPPKGPQNVVPPPVEHGSFQAGLNPEPQGSRPPSVGIPPQFEASPSLQHVNSQVVPNRPSGIPPQSDESPSSPPTVCDGAILSCCHRQEVTNDCFAREGCGELEYDRPCEPKVLLKIVNKFTTHFKSRG